MPKKITKGGCFLEHGQLLFVDLSLGPAVILGLDGHDGLGGSQTGREQDAVQGADDDQRQAGPHGVGELDDKLGVLIGGQVAVELSGNGGTGTQRESRAGGDGGNAQGKHDFGGLDADALNRLGQQRSQNAKDNHRALDELAEQDGHQDIAQHDFGQAAFGKCVQAVGYLFDKLGLVEARGHHKHCHNHDAVVVAEIAQHRSPVDTARYQKGGDRGHGDHRHGKLAIDVKCHSNCTDDQADNQLWIHVIRPFLNCCRNPIPAGSRLPVQRGIQLIRFLTLCYREYTRK